jgi:hypothetical protein
MRIIKAGAVYFLLLFALGWVLGPVRELVLAPRVGRAVALLVEAPVMIAAMALAARWVVRRFAFAPDPIPRAGIGATALVLLLAFELAGVRWVRELSLAEYLATFDWIGGAVTVATFLLFAAMPALVARGETR